MLRLKGGLRVRRTQLSLYEHKTCENIQTYAHTSQTNVKNDKRKPKGKTNMKQTQCSEAKETSVDLLWYECRKIPHTDELYPLEESQKQRNEVQASNNITSNDEILKVRATATAAVCAVQVVKPIEITVLWHVYLLAICRTHTHRHTQHDCTVQQHNQQHQQRTGQSISQQRS